MKTKKITFNIGIDLDSRIREYIKQYNMPYTTFLILASERFLKNEEQGALINESLQDVFIKEIQKLGKNAK